jgi:arylsulfatase A-like enzyme
VNHLYYRLNRQNVTAAELLARAGYATGAFVSSFVMIRDFSGLDRGFQVYDDFVDERERYRENYERQAGRTLALAWSWIERHRQEPFFCFIHLIDPHGPYTPPGEFAHRFHSSTAVPVRGHIPPYQQIPGVYDFNVYRDLYDGEIAYASHELGSFLTALKSSSLFDPTLIVFVADHGEAMGGHGVYFAHGTGLFEDNVHVPMIVKPPAGLRAVRGSRVAQPVSVVDLLPTVLEILGRPRLPVFAGTSLVPLLAGRPGGGGGVFFELHEPQLLAGEVRAGRKTILDGEHVEQYDLAADPGEVRPLPPERCDAAVAELRRWQLLVAGWRRPFAVEPNFMATARRGAFVRGRHPAGPADPNPDDIARLRSLGYL